VKVALSGDGGDELFGGYDRYRALGLARRLRKWAPANVWRAIAGLMPGVHPKARLSRAKRLFRSVGDSAAHRYASYLRLFDDSQISALVQPELRKQLSPPDVVESMFSSMEGRRDDVLLATQIDRLIYLPSDLLTKVDRCSMLHALEVRSPFMDHELVEFAATLTTAQLLKGGPKRMLREAFAADLPAWVFKRKKRGFAVPIGEWFRGPLRAMLRDHLFAADSFARGHFNMPVVERLIDEHERGRVDHSQRLYALLMLELWWKTQKS
jgi:asparagine synthase (glutamine-hydrolysing)